MAGSAPEYVEAVLRLLNDPDERERVAVAGRQRVLDRHLWRRSMQRLDGILKDCWAPAATAEREREHEQELRS